MTKVLVNLENDLPVLIDARGHAEYDVLGKDIVCAAISTTFLLTANTLEKNNSKSVSVKVNEKKGEFHLSVNYEIMSDAEKLCAKNALEAMIDVLNEIARDYPKNLQIILN